MKIKLKYGEIKVLCNWQKPAAGHFDFLSRFTTKKGQFTTSEYIRKSIIPTFL